MKLKYILFGCLVLLVLGIGVYYNLPKETITIIDIPPIKIPAIVIP